VAAAADRDEAELRGGLVLREIGLERGRDDGGLRRSGSMGEALHPLEQVGVGEDRGSSSACHMPAYMTDWRAAVNPCEHRGQPVRPKET
jgi:hypothetical protein